MKPPRLCVPLRLDPGVEDSQASGSLDQKRIKSDRRSKPVSPDRDATNAGQDAEQTGDSPGRTAASIQLPIEGCAACRAWDGRSGACQGVRRPA